MAALHLHLPLPSIIQTPSSSSSSSKPLSPFSVPSRRPAPARPNLRLRLLPGPAFSVGREDIELSVSTDEEEEEKQEVEDEEEVPVSPEDLEYIEQIKRVLELLRKNRDMTFGEVKLTIMIEDPRDIERKRLLGIEDDEVTRDDLAAALEDIHEGIIPKNRIALRLLAEEMIQWPDLEVEAPKSKPRKSLYAKATDTGIDPQVAARRLNIDWDSAVDIEEEDDSDEIEVPPAVNTMPDHALHHLPKVNHHSFKYLVTILPSLAHAMASSEVEFVVAGDDDEEEEEDDCCNEKQISVDPVSLKQTPRVLPSLVKPKFVSASLPCSATSSPKFSSSLPKSFKKWSNPSQLPHPAFHPSLARQQSIAQLKYPQQQQGMLLPRSKSCGDGRSSQPCDEFDILSRRHKNITVQPQTGVLTSESSSKVREEIYALECKEEEFKCGAMCLFLPGFAKKKQEQVQLRRQAIREVKAVEKEGEDDDDEEEEEEDAHDEVKEENKSVASRVASLERFECASWSSATILDDNEDDYEGGINAYFDLPLELIRGSTDDAHSPVKTAFVFDRERKGVLKKSTSKSGPRKSCDSSNRHVRFSTSTPVSFPPSPNSGCITPRLFQAREEFNAALLEAQNAYINF